MSTSGTGASSSLQSTCLHEKTKGLNYAVQALCKNLVRGTGIEPVTPAV